MPTTSGRTDIGGSIMVHRIFQMEHDDARALQRLGAATVLLWSRLPKAIQEELVQQAQAIEGMSDPAAVARRIHELVNRGDVG
jgi:hypothetical protein